MNMTQIANIFRKEPVIPEKWEPFWTELSFVFKMADGADDVCDMRVSLNVKIDV